jgi:hypothetical protein
MCGSTYGHGMIIQFVIQYGSFKKKFCTTWLCYIKYTSFDILPLHMNCTLGMYQWKVRGINYERDLKLYEDPQCSVLKMILYFLVLHLISRNKVL